MLGDNNKPIGHANEKKNDESMDSQGLYIPSRQTGAVVASVILLGFVLFVTGFFWGQKDAVSSFTNKIEQESFGDQIYSSLCALCDSQGDVEEDEDHNDETYSEKEAIEQSDEKAVDGTESASCDSQEDGNNTEAHEIQGTTPEMPEYYAQLAGFGTMRAAQHFATRLQKKDVSVIVKKRQSRSSRGKFVAWYQVVTEKFTDKGDLEALVKRLEYEEKLNDVRVETC